MHLELGKESRIRSVKKTAILFSGQGAQFSGMMKDIAEESYAAKNVFHTADNVLNRSISELCFFGTQEELNLTHNTQPCVLAADLAAYAAIIEKEIRPDAVAGFSLGEYAALTAAGVIEIEDAFSIVQKRADFMQEAVPVGKGAMAAILMTTEDTVLELCEAVSGYVIPANYNCPGQIVVSGETEAVDQVLVRAKERKIRGIKLSVSAPFHCKMMHPAAEKLEDVLNNVFFSNPTIPMYMNVDGKVELNPEKIKRKLIDQAESPVLWERILRNMYNDGIKTFVEAGPGKVLSGFIKKTFSGDECVNVFHVTDMTTLRSMISELKEQE